MDATSTPPPGPAKCETCGTDFSPYRSWVKTCSRKCREGLKDRPTHPWAKEREVTCKTCSGTFTVVANGGQYHHCPACQPLVRAAAQERKNKARKVGANPGRRAKNLQYALTRYGLTPQELTAMVVAQGNRCAICGDLPDPNGVKAASRLHVDHCHATGRNRALLCGRCNMGVGYFRDDPELMLAAAGYIRSHAAEVS